MSNDWVGLDDEAVGSQQVGGTQYVGVVETPDAPEVRAPRQPVRRVAPSAKPVQNKSFVAREGSFRGSRQQESLVYFPTEFGAQVAINQEAAANMSRSKVHDVGGQRALRIQPGQYMVIVPESRFPDEPPRRARRRPQDSSEEAMNGMGTDWAAFTRGLVGSLATLGTGIATAVVTNRQQERQAELDRLSIQVGAEAAAAARETATAEQQRQHTQNMARIRQQMAELTALQQTGAAAPAGAPVVAPGGTSQVVWVAVAVVALGGIGGLVWFLSSRGKSEK